MMEISKLEGNRPEIEDKDKVLVMGSFTGSDVIVQSSDNRMPDNPILRKQAEEWWNPKWFTGSLVRLESFDLLDNKLILRFGETDFKEYVGSRDLGSLRKFGAESLSNPISTSTVIITSDGKIVVADKSIGDAAGSIDVPGGYIHPVKDINSATGQIDVFKAALREVGEEVFFGKKEITDQELVETERLITQKICLGLSYEYAGLCHPVLSFAMSTSLTSQELDQRVKQIQELPDQEIKVRIINPEKVPDDPNVEYAIKLLAGRYPRVEPDGRVTIALARKWLAGVDYSKRELRRFNQL